MKLTILVDNNTYIDRYLTGEPGVCYYIECSGLKLLFDVGYSDIFLKNAQILISILRTLIKLYYHMDITITPGG